MAKKATAIKIPTNRLLFYNTSALSSVTWTGGNKFNLVRDFAAVNRHNMAHTTSKGVPLVYRCAVTIMPQVDTGTYNQIFDEDDALIQVAEVHLAPNTWVTRNAIVKTHAARENMFKQQGVKKSERGAYSRTLRPTWDADPDTFRTPQKGDTAGGQVYAGGTWDYSALYADDGDLTHIRMVGDTGMNSLYLDSRKQIDADSNSDSDDTDQPLETNILRQLLSPTLGISAKDDEVIALARDEQDNPPYSLDNNGDHTDMVLAGRQYIGGRAGISSTEIYDIPCGIFEMKCLNAFMDAGQSEGQPFSVKVELLGIYSM
ncbi:MAG: hypothetical protein [Circular genetic element sp.]|nr:MAG: hypothetical protein [Circular genetic element sp.]